jgi:hypothetical protein
MCFSGPNGKVTMIPGTPRVYGASHVLESLARLDTSKIERLEINFDRLRSGDLPY